MRPLSIHHVIHCMDRRSGGPAESLRILAQEQVLQGHNVTILTTDVQATEPWLESQQFLDDLSEEMKSIGVSLLVAKGFGRTGALRRFRCLYNPNSFFRGAFEKRPDVVHIHGLYSHLTMAASSHARSAGIPYFIRPAGGLNRRCRDRGNSLGKDLLFHLLESKNLQSAAAIHVTSRREREEVEQLLPNAHYLRLPHGAQKPEMPNYIADRMPFILYLSRLHPKKRPELLLQCYAKNHKNTFCQLVFAGPDGGSEALLRKMTADLGLTNSVHFPGHLTDNEKAFHLLYADFLALPSLDENFAFVVLEAMASGCPVLTTKGVDASEFIKKSHGGIVTDLDEESFLEGFDQMLSSDSGKMGSNGSRYFEENLSIQKICAQLTDAYRECGGIQ